MNIATAEPLLALIEAACESLVDLRAGDDPTALREECRDQLESIAMAAELAGLDDVQAQTEAHCAALDQLGSSDMPTLVAEVEKLEHWVADLRGLLEGGAAHGQACAAQSPTDVQQCDRETLDSTYANVGSTAAGGSLRQALADAFRDECGGLPKSAADVEAQLVLARQFGSACEHLGNPALARVFELVERNLEALGAQSPSAQQQDLLRRWPAAVSAYLSNGDESSCAELALVLEHAAWPSPLAAPETHALLQALAAAVDNDEHDDEPSLRVAETDHVSLQLAHGLAPELLDAFFQEVPAQCEALSQCVMHLIARANVPENLRAAQRLAHTIKGAGNLIGVNGVANVAHYLEDILEALDDDAPMPQALALLLQEAADCLETMIEFLQGTGAPPQGAQQLLQRLLDCGTGESAASTTGETADRAGEVSSPPTPRQNDPVTEPEPDRAPAARSAESTSADDTTAWLRVNTASVDEMFRLAGEVAIGVGQIQDRIKRLLSYGELLREHDPVLQRTRLALENQVNIRAIAADQRRGTDRRDASFDSLELDRYDALYGSAHAFMESSVDLREMAMDLQQQLQMLDRMFGAQQRLNSELQELIVGTRMVSVDSIASRLQRTVRQTSRMLNRQATLHLTGGNQLLDNDVLRALVDPLMHLLRNALDHGIETPAERLAKGKDASGHIELSFHKDGSFVTVTLSDDGAGIDYEALRAAALRQGMIGGDEQPQRRELLRLVTMPGFSTREHTTQISGRGVGMDVVQAAVSRLKGTMEILDGEPCGCTIRIRVPTSLISHHCVLVEVAGRRVAIPSQALERIAAPGVGELDVMGNAISYREGNEIYPAQHLHELVDFQAPSSAPVRPAVLLANVDQRVVAVTVARVLDGGELVVKQIGRYVPTVQGVHGVAVLGDGATVPVLDLAALLRRPMRSNSPQPQPQPSATPASTQPQVLIVDDSLSMRRSLSTLIRDAGWIPHPARDGLEAIKVMEEAHVDLILLDLEMPRMNGLEFTRYLRADAQTRGLPVIMITSRGMGKHRRRAEAAGVTLYLNKPVSNDDLLDHVHQQLHDAADATAA